MTTDTAPTDRPYIVRRAPGGGVKVQHYIGTDLFVSRVDETRSTGRTLGGMFHEVESTGRKVAGVLRLRLNGFRGSGDKGEHSAHVRTNPVDVKKLVRRVRPEELARLAEADGRIAELQAQLKAERLARAEVAAEAWVKAHVVTVKELEALCDAAEQLRQTTRHGMDDETRKQVAAAHAEIRAMFSRARPSWAGALSWADSAQNVFTRCYCRQVGERRRARPRQERQHDQHRLPRNLPD